VIVVAHRPSVLQHADKLLLLRHGMVDAFGDRQEIIAKLNAAAAAARATPLAAKTNPRLQSA
jgi:ABC-type protease/lipase transport system fused ATPase/permease subunit